MTRFYSKKVSNEYGDFDSITEFEYFKLLKQRELNGEISQLEMQKPFTLIDSFKDKNGAVVRKMDYVSDFCYFEDGIYHVVDVKGSEYLIEQVFKNKLKMMKWLYRDYEYHVIIKDKTNKQWVDLEDKAQKKAMKEREKAIPKKVKKKTKKKQVIKE